MRERVPPDLRSVPPTRQPQPEELLLSALELPLPELLLPELPPLLFEPLDELLALLPPLLLEPPPLLELWPALPPDGLLELLLDPALDPEDPALD